MSSKKAKETQPETPLGDAAVNDQAVKGEPVSETAAEAALEATENLDEICAQLAEARQQANEYKDGWQRSLADFQNYKRRIEVERAEMHQNAVGMIIKRYLPVVDDLERALASRPPDLPWAEGIELIYRKLKTILENEGLKQIEAQGQPFDPNFHEAIAQEPAEGVESGTVIEVVQQGYLLGDRVIRPAVVRVAQ